MSHFNNSYAVDGFNGRELLIIGRGKLARHFVFSFQLLSPEIVVHSWNREQTLDELKVLLEKVSLVSLCISDDSLDSVASLLESFRPRGLVAHHSGSKNVKDVWGFHPLMTFSGFEAYPSEVYQSIPFVISPPPGRKVFEEDGRQVFEKFFPGWKNKIYFVSAEDKVRYHLACVIAGNFPNILWKESTSRMEALRLPLEILKPYLEQSLENFFSDPTGSLTGPLQRGDESTLKAHLESLKEDPFLPVYESFLHFVKSNKNKRGSL